MWCKLFDEENLSFYDELEPVKPPLVLFKNIGDKSYRKFKASEKLLSEANFTVHKFNNRPRPNKKENIKIISCFSEFGCEVFGAMYCLPKVMSFFPGQYIIAAGWHGREYLYRHLVDEFWEINEDCMYLREYTRAFHNHSRNLKNIEHGLTEFGGVIPSAALGKYAVMNLCHTCGKNWNEWRKREKSCPSCKSTVINRSFFSDIKNYKSKSIKIPRPDSRYLDWAKSILKPNTVGVFARNRMAYGRNLPSEFYVDLIGRLEKMGYNVIWLGEKQSVLPCPVEHILDFSRMPESRHLELTLAIIANLKFTIQFWTASSRLSGIMGVPFLIVESPEQIYATIGGLASAQEGKRLELTTLGKRKIMLSHYKNAVENPTRLLRDVENSIIEMNDGNWDDYFSMVENVKVVQDMQREYYEMLE